VSNEQILALAVFAVVILLLSVGMFPSMRRLDGRQKYRRLRRPGPDADPDTNSWQSIPPLAAVLAFLTGGAAAGEQHADDASDVGGYDSGDAGGDGGGGDGGGGGGK
jgi:hypothetical protein